MPPPGYPQNPYAGYPAYGQPMVTQQIQSTDTAGSDISKLLPANGQGNMITVLLALIAVMGGGAAWRFYAQRSKQKHDEALRELELREKSALASREEQRQKYDAGLVACTDATKALNARVDDLVGKIGDLNNSVEVVGKRMAETEELVTKCLRAASRLDELEARVDECERKLKRMSKQDEEKL
jgi:hypothetical protein